MTSIPEGDPVNTLGNASRGLAYEEPLLFERSRPGRRGVSLPSLDVPEADPDQILGDRNVRHDLQGLPELSEVEVVRHFTRLSTWNASVDFGLYPLGSCTMKYNPKINDQISSFNGFSRTHPMQPIEESQGLLAILKGLETFLSEISGMDAISLQPAAGAQGELAGIMMIRKYHEANGEHRTKILVPDSAHGTNPASAALNAYKVVAIASGPDGILHPEEVEKAMGSDVAGLMITNPNTLGLFEEHVARITEIVHAKGGLVYGDGANLNALLGIVRPGDIGIDVMHFNLHKTFSTPHGGGGPGAGPVGVKEILEPYLPVPRIRTGSKGEFSLSSDFPQSVGRLHGYFGNVGMLVRAYVYIKSLGQSGLRCCSEMAVLNANYLLTRLREHYHVPFDSPVMHECVVSDKDLNSEDVTTIDIAKRLIDYGYHPPTTYFPLIAPGAIMIEPTESESLQGLNAFVGAMVAIESEAHENSEILRNAPHRTRHARLDETNAARKPVLRWNPAKKIPRS